MNDKNFVSGIRFNTPHAKAPSWVKGTISIKVDEFIAYAAANQDDRGWINIDVKESKGGNLYCELNTYQQNKAATAPHPEEGYGERDPALSVPSIDEPLPEENNSNDIPF